MKKEANDFLPKIAKQINFDKNSKLFWQGIQSTGTRLIQNSSSFGFGLNINIEFLFVKAFKGVKLLKLLSC